MRSNQKETRIKVLLHKSQQVQDYQNLSHQTAIRVPNILYSLSNFHRSEEDIFPSLKDSEQCLQEREWICVPSPPFLFFYVQEAIISIWTFERLPELKLRKSRKTGTFGHPEQKEVCELLREMEKNGLKCGCQIFPQVNSGER